jgi:hypothetical protein
MSRHITDDYRKARTNKSRNGVKASRNAGGDGGGGGGSGGLEMTRCDVMRTDASALLLHSSTKGIRFISYLLAPGNRDALSPVRRGGILPELRLGWAFILLFLLATWLQDL